MLSVTFKTQHVRTYTFIIYLKHFLNVFVGLDPSCFYQYWFLKGHGQLLHMRTEHHF